MAIAKDTEDWTSLLYGKKGSKAETVQSNVDTIPVDEGSDGIEAEKLFEYDPVGDKKSITKTVRRTITTLANHILPKDMLEEEYVKNKIEQDIATLTELYVTRKNNEMVLQSLIKGISTGSNSPKMYEMYTKLSETVSDNNKQILETEDNLRKTYMELKYEVQSKRAELINDFPNFGKLSNSETQQPKAINQTYTGSKGLLEKMKERQRQKARKDAENVQDIAFV